MSTYAVLDQTPRDEIRSTGTTCPNRTSPGIRGAGERKRPMTCSVAPRGGASHAILRRRIPREKLEGLCLPMPQCSYTPISCSNHRLTLRMSTRRRIGRGGQSRLNHARGCERPASAAGKMINYRSSNGIRLTDAGGLSGRRITLDDVSDTASAGTEIELRGPIAVSAISARLSQHDGGMAAEVNACAARSLFCYRNGESTRRTRAQRVLAEPMRRVAPTRVNLAMRVPSRPFSIDSGT
jgi:hypothetical protein